jgi:hypothetical protein
MKQIIRLTESDLHRIVKVSVNRILREGKFNPGGRINLGAEMRQKALEKQVDRDNREAKKEKAKKEAQKQAQRDTRLPQNGEVKRHIFKVDRELDPPSNFTGIDVSRHFKDERQERNTKVLQEDLDNAGNPLCSFKVYTGHPKGWEVHTITDRAIVVCQNLSTGILITIKPAIPKEIEEYWKKLGRRLPEVVVNMATRKSMSFKDLLAAAEYNEEHGLNKIKG